MRLLVLPLFLTGALLMGCDRRTASPDASTDAKAADAQAAADKDAADAKAAADKDAADAKAAADKAAADAKADAAKAAANAKADAAQAAANAKADADKADAVRSQASKLLADLQTAVTGQKWTDAGALVEQLDPIRDKLAADQKASFDSLKKQYHDNTR